MNPVRADQILSFEQYERVRSIIRPLLIAEKSRRRLGVGSHLTLLFENPRTVWYQVQEMIRTEKIAADQAIAHELETYNELVPRRGEFVATMLVEYADTRERDAALRRLVGIERHVAMIIAGRKLPAKFDDRQISTERVSAVQFVRFPLGAIGAEDFLAQAELGRVAVEVDHPNLKASAEVAGAIALALAEDLS